jgi:hypothetical protein
MSTQLEREYHPSSCASQAGETVLQLIGYDCFVELVDLITEWEFEEDHMASDLVDRLLPVLCRKFLLQAKEVKL